MIWNGLELPDKPYFQDDAVIIYHSDCREILPLIPDKSVDLVLTSPPYNKTGLRNGELGHSHDWHADMNYFDSLPEYAYWEWQVSIFHLINRILRNTGSLFYNHKVRRFDGVAHHPLMEISSTELKLYQQIIWDRGCALDNNLMYLQPTTELIFWFVKETPVVFKSKAQFKTEIWRIHQETNSLHPAPFPESLAYNCINLSCDEKSLVLDPFLGSGTTAYCAKKLGRKCIGIEIEERYCEIAARRCSQSVMRLEV